MKPLDGVNKPTTALAGLGFIVLSALSNPQAQAALIAGITHPTVSNVVSGLGIIAGIAALYVSKPIGTSNTPTP